MKKIFIYLLLAVTGITVSYGQETLTQANEAYAQEDYIKAIELYEQTLKEQGVSSDLYYNLGNAYYKHNEFAKAILNYERALLLNPGNEDARFNLDMANTHIVDKIDPVGRFFLSVWIDSLRSFLSSNAWAVIGIVSFLLFLLGCYLYLFSPRRLFFRPVRREAVKEESVLLCSNRFVKVIRGHLPTRHYAMPSATTISVVWP